MRRRSSGVPLTRSIAGYAALLIVVAFVAGSAFLVVNRLTRQGEPAFIADIKPEYADRFSAGASGGGLLSSPNTFVNLYGTDRPFEEIADHYRAALTARGFAPREQGTSSDPDSDYEFETRKDSDLRCVTLSPLSTAAHPIGEYAKVPGYSYAYLVVYRRHCGL